MRRGVLLLLIALVAPLPATASDPQAPDPREGAVHSVPLYGELLRPYDAPDNPFAPGHRGADVGAPAGTPVRSSADGTVAFAGNVAGNLSVSVDHPDGVRTTYSFLGSIAVAADTPVERGDVVGTVGEGHPGLGLPPHVHLSARTDGVYFDPLSLYVGLAYDDLVSLVG